MKNEIKRIPKEEYEKIKKDIEGLSKEEIDNYLNNKYNKYAQDIKNLMKYT